MDHALAAACPGPALTHHLKSARWRAAGPPRERLRTRVLPARLPHTIQLCIHCRDRPARFWVSRTSGQTVRRPSRPSGREGLDRDRCDVIPFDS